MSHNSKIYSANSMKYNTLLAEPPSLSPAENAGRGRSLCQTTSTFFIEHAGTVFIPWLFSFDRRDVAVSCFTVLQNRACNNARYILYMLKKKTTKFATVITPWSSALLDKFGDCLRKRSWQHIFHSPWRLKRGSQFGSAALREYQTSYQLLKYIAC